MQPQVQSTTYSNIQPMQAKVEDTLTRARRFDRDTLAYIHDRYYADVYRYVRFRLENEAVVEDIVSDVFLRLLDALNRGSGPLQNLRGWLLGTASNLVNDHLRLRYNRPAETINEDDQIASQHPGENPERAFDQNWSSGQIRQAMQSLTAEQQDVLALRFVEEYSLEETAALMKKTITAIKQLQFRAIASLRRILEAKLQ